MFVPAKTSKSSGMTNIDFEDINLRHLITHLVGNKGREEDILVSSEESTIDDETRELLIKYFLQPIKTEEFYSFTHTLKLEMNEVYTVVQEIFDNPEEFVELSKNLAKLLYEQSLHPNIKEGKLNIAHFAHARFNEAVVDAIGIFKSENDVPFLKMVQGDDNFEIKHEYGFDTKGIDKGCIILNTYEEDGYRLLIIDNKNKAIEAQYWRDDFLQVKPVSNEFHQTNQFMNITKNYLTKEITKEFEVPKTEQIDLLNRSVEYFKEKESFDKESFNTEVLQDENLIRSFQGYSDSFTEEHDIQLSDNFEISNTAVKKQARVFKSVLKLDKNFHIYIHGNKNLIEQGVDDQGRKFYKIFYEEER